MTPAGKRFGPYTILGEIARGAQGAVMRAQHDPTGKPRALKMLLDRDPQGVKRFHQEARVLAALSHPNLIRVLDLGERNGLAYMAMELVEGEDLATILKQRGVPDLAWTARVLGTIANTLHFCHERGLVHRDLKPQNILVERGTDRPVLVDFGMVKRDPEKMRLSSLDGGSLLSRTGELKGTPRYMAPEQANPARFGVAGPWTDVYALGANLYFLLTGEPAFTGTSLVGVLRKVVDEPAPNPAALNRHVPATLAQLCQRAMTKNPEDRPPSAEVFAQELVAAARIAPLPISASASGESQPAAFVGQALRSGDPRSLGPYEIQSLLGQGGMGSVYRGQHRVLGVVRAIKALTTLGGPRRVQRFAREIEHLSQVRHPNVIAIHDAGHEGTITWYAMDLLGGEPLNEVIEKGPLPFEQAMDVGVGVARGIAALHRAGIVHRDIKPHNVVLRGDGQPVVLDLGLAVAPELDDRLTRTGALVGTPRYMAPEQLSGKTPAPTIDVYALGLVLYELFTGEAPGGLKDASTPHEVLAALVTEAMPPPSRVDPTLPRGLDLLFGKLLARNPEDRLPDAGAVVTALLDLRGDEPAARTRSPLAALAAAMVLLGIVAVIVGVALRPAGPAEAEASQGSAGEERTTTPSPSPPKPRKLSKKEITEARREIRRIRRIPKPQARVQAARDWLVRYEGHEQTSDVETLLRETLRSYPQRIFAGATGGVFVDEYRALVWTNVEKEPAVLRLWDLSRDEPLREWKLPYGIFCVALAPNGSTFAVGGWNNAVRLYKLGTGEELQRWPINTAYRVEALAFSPSGDRLAAGARRRKVGGAAGEVEPVAVVVDTTTGKPMLTLPEHRGGQVMELAYTPDGTRLISVGGTVMITRALQVRDDPDNFVRIHDATTGELIKKIPTASRPNFIRFHPDRRRFATGTLGGSFYLIDAYQAKIVQTFVGNIPGTSFARKGAIRAGVFSKDGSRIVTAFGESDRDLGFLDEWDTRSGKRVWEMDMPALLQLQGSPSGDRLLVTSSRGVELWLAR